MDAEDDKPVPAAEPIISENSAPRSPIVNPILTGAGRGVPAAATEQSLPSGEQAPQRLPGALQQLCRRLERGGGLRGARLAELALRAGITVPPREAGARGGGSLEASLWMELVRENATLRHEADKLAERQETLSRRIQRAKARLQALRLKVIQRRTGLTAKDLLEMPSPPTWQDLVQPRPNSGAPGDKPTSNTKAKPAGAGGEKLGEEDDESTRATE